VRPGSEGGEPGRRREAGPVGADALDVAQEPGELDGKGSPEVGVDGPGTVCDGHGLLDEAGASRSYERKDAKEARKLFRNWGAWVHAMRGQTGELLEPIARAARMVEGHLEGILAHWTRGLTTAFMKGLNSLFSAVKRKARGYRTVEYMTAKLYFVAGKRTLPCY
jgi:hypothetical protein